MLHRLSSNLIMLKDSDITVKNFSRNGSTISHEIVGY